MGMTASAPGGTTPPVAIAIASPSPSSRDAGRPAAIRSTTTKLPGVSAARTANPSIAELGNGGKSTAARASRANTRPAADSMLTASDASGLTRARISRSATSIVSSDAMGDAILGTDVISVVIPIHNEERSIALLHEELQAALEPLREEWEAVYVDDGSTDGSFAALTRLHAREENVRVVRLRRNFGKAAALATGFAQVEGAAPRPAHPPHSLQALQPRRRLDVGPAAARHELRPEGLPARRRPKPRALRRAAPLHPGARARAGLSRGGAAGEPPPARARPLPLRARAVPARLPRPAHGVFHGPLPPPPASPLRRAGPAALRQRNYAARLPDRRQAHRPRDRTAAVAHARGLARRRRDAVLLARADQRDDHEPPRGACDRTRAA